MSDAIDDVQAAGDASDAWFGRALELSRACERAVHDEDLALWSSLRCERDEAFRVARDLARGVVTAVAALDTPTLWRAWRPGSPLVGDA